MRKENPSFPNLCHVFQIRRVRKDGVFCRQISSINPLDRDILASLIDESSLPVRMYGSPLSFSLSGNGISLETRSELAMGELAAKLERMGSKVEFDL